MIKAVKNLCRLTHPTCLDNGLSFKEISRDDKRDEIETWQNIRIDK